MVSVELDLRTGVSLWDPIRIQSLNAQPLTRDIDADVVIAGMGVSGAFIGELLAADGFDVAMVDRRGPARGSTAASTALVQYEIDEPLSLLGKKIGAIDAIRAWRRSHLAVAGIAARTDELGVICDLVARRSLYLAGDRLDQAELQVESEARRAAGFESLFLPRKELQERFGIDRPAALVGYGDFAVNPRRLTAGYLQCAGARGARLLAPVEIADVDAGATRVLATTADGVKLRSRVLVLATGYEFPKFVPLKGHSLISTYAFATAPQKRRLWPEECLIWEASDPYLYMRTTPDGRALIGGEDEDFVDEEKRDALLDKKIAAIGRKAQKLFPDLDVAPEFAWAGTFGASKTGLPTIGEIPGYPNCWAVLGYGGNGLTGSRIAAEIIRTALAGGMDPDAGLYAFNR